MTAPGYRCRYCGRATHHPKDVANSHCPCCGSARLDLIKDCPHRTPMATARDQLVQGMVMGAVSTGVEITVAEIVAALDAGTPDYLGVDRACDLVDRKRAAQRRRT